MPLRMASKPWAKTIPPALSKISLTAARSSSPNNSKPGIGFRLPCCYRAGRSGRMQRQHVARVGLGGERYRVLVECRLQGQNQTRNLVKIAARDAPRVERARHAELVGQVADDLRKAFCLSLGGPFRVR